MKFKFPHLLGLALLCLSLSLNAQKKTSSKVYLLEQMRHYQNENSSVEHFFSEHQNRFQFAADSEMKKLATQKGKNGMRHHKYQQFHRGIPVFGAIYLLHEKAGKLTSSNGYFRPQVELDVVPTISAEEALQIAKADHRAKTYASKMQPLPKLCIIDPVFPKRSESLALAYQLEVHSWEPYDKQLYFINAHNGQVLQKFPLLHSNGVPAKAQTKYYGEQTIIVDSISPTTFHLHDDTRGNGISTFNYDLSIFTNNSTNWDLTNEDQDEVALDAHYCTEKFYDLLLNEFQWNGLDNQGRSMNTIVHAEMGENYLNAFWDGEYAWFGNGDCNNGPLTTMEVVGHEFTHGIIDHTSRLIYRDEPGAINEHLADALGKALEYKEDPANFSWTIGSSFKYSPHLLPFRSMEDPAAFDLPDFYNGAHWQSGNGVHTNSSIGNYWFYLLSEGKSGINEAGQSYNITAIGIEKAAAIAFHTNRFYLINSSDYTDYYESSLLAAAELYGMAATEVSSVREAWKAVGLPNTAVFPIDLELSVDPNNQVLRTCILGEYADFIFSVTNVGTNDYYPENGDHVNVYDYPHKEYDFDVAITDTLLVGESIQFVIKDSLFIDQSNQYSTIYKLNVDQDQNSDNDRSRFIVINSIHAGPEVSLTAYTQSYDCFNKSYKFMAFVWNQSCTPLAAGTEMTFHLYDSSSNVVWSEAVVLTDELRPGYYHTFRQEAVVDWKQEIYTLEIDLSGDQDLSNNQRVIYLQEPKLIEEEYLNNFEDSSYTEKMHFRTVLSEDRINYNGDQLFATSTFLNQGPFFNYDLCPELEDNFESDLYTGLISGRIDGCLDLSSMSYPLVEFDLIQFRDDLHPRPSEHSAMLQFAWEGSDSGQQIIYGQTEGERVHYSFNLPASFIGNYSFKFLNRSGNNSSPQVSDFLNYDVNLIDNIHFHGSAVSTKNLSTSSLQIYPNPVSQELHLRDAMNIAAFRIINAQGHVLMEKAYKGQAIDLSTLAGGYYWLSVSTLEGTKLIKPFIKLSH